MRFFKLFFIMPLLLAPQGSGGQEVFTFGSGAIPDPRMVSIQSDTDLNPLATLGSVAITDRGSWAAGTAFGLGDKVTINGVSFVARQAHTSSASFSTDCSAGKWVLNRSYQRSSFNVGRFLSLTAYSSASAWASGTVYGFGSRVTWNGVHYVSWQRHTSSSSFTSDISAGYWILYSSAPSLSAFTMEAPSGSACPDFDAYFQSGETVLTGTVDLVGLDPSGTGEDARGTMTLKITFDWDSEELKDYKLTLNMSSYPNMSSGGAYEASWADDHYGFTAFSFHSSSYNWDSHNRCGRFVLALAGGHSNSINETIYTYESVFPRAQILFKKKGGRYVPVLSFLTTSPNNTNRTEFYNAIWNAGVSTEYYLETNSAIME